MSDDKPEGMKNSSSAANNEQYSTLLQVQEVCSKLSSSGICLTDDYADWVEIGFALANELGESGRSFFHELSCMSSKYDAAECDKKYDNCLRTGNGSVTIATFFQRAKDAGVDIRMKNGIFANIATSQRQEELIINDNSLNINTYLKSKVYSVCFQSLKTHKNVLKPLHFSSSISLILHTN